MFVLEKSVETIGYFLGTTNAAKWVTRLATTKRSRINVHGTKISALYSAP